LPDDPPEKPDEVTDAVGIDVGILKYVHDSDGTAVESPDLSDERERLERAQRNVETALPADTDSVSAKRVIEVGSPTLKERTALAVSE